MTQLLYNEVKEIPQIKVTQKVQANAVFPKKIITKFNEKYSFYITNEQTFEIRWICSFNATKEECYEFCRDTKENDKGILEHLSGDIVIPSRFFCCSIL